MKKISVLFWIFSLLLPLSVPAEAPQLLRVAGWGGYADPDRADKTIGYQSFEKRFNVTIAFTPLNNLDDIVSVAESELHYDVYIVSNEGIRLLYDMGLVSPINLDLLPHYQDLHHNLKYSEWAQFDSKLYAIPWAWGPTGLIYDEEAVVNPNSWNLLWDPQYRDKVALWDDPSMIWTTALSLGYKNVYNLTQWQLFNVKNRLLALNNQRVIYYQGDGDELELAMQGKIVAFNSRYNPSARLKAAGKNFAMAIPKEGAVGMFDSYLISKRQDHPEHIDFSHQYINHQISPEIQQEMVRLTGLAPANIETLSLLTREEIHSLHLDDPNYFNRMLLWNQMPRKNLYEQLLEEVRESRKVSQK